MNCFVNYITYFLMMVGLACLYVRETSFNRMIWSKGELKETLTAGSKELSRYIHRHEISSVSDLGIFYLESQEWDDDRLGRLWRPTGFERIHQSWLLMNHLWVPVPQFIPGEYSIVAVEEKGESSSIAIGRGTYVGVPLVVFAHAGEVVHIAKSNSDALDYFIGRWGGQD